MAVVLAVLGICSNAWAQTVPKPKEFYFDEDKSTTRAVVVVPGEGDAVVDKLAAVVQRDPRAADARAQLGTLAMAGGRRRIVPPVRRPDAALDLRRRPRGRSPRPGTGGGYRAAMSSEIRPVVIATRAKLSSTRTH